jgi:predicted acyl esterase
LAVSHLSDVHFGSTWGGERLALYELIETHKDTLFFFAFTLVIIESWIKMPNQIRDIATRDETSFSYIFEQNLTISLKDNSGLVRCNVYRPKTSEKVPVLVTYGPYGKDISYEA